jgi:tricarballylate dehydrogenase
LPEQKLRATIDTFNAACGSAEKFHPTELDGLTTSGLAPAKSNWARPIVTPPFYGYSLRPGVTFTYLGLKVDENARTTTQAGPIKNLWAAGETMAGSILGQ